MSMTTKSALWITEGTLVFGVCSELPYDDGLITRSGKNDVWAVRVSGVDGCGDRSDPSGVALEVSSQ